MRSFAKYLMMVTFLVSSFAVLAFAQAPPPPQPWFDLENCEMCKPLAEHPELLHNMTWEQHNITNGIISVTTVREPFMKQYEEAQMEMAAVAARMQTGEQVKLCPSCVAFGQCIMKGATVEQVKTMHGGLMMILSDKPELVAEIQAWGQRTNDEMKKMEAMEKKMMQKKMGEEGQKVKEMKKEKKVKQD